MGTGLANRRTVSDPQRKPGAAGLFLLIRETSHFRAPGGAGTLAPVKEALAPIQERFSSGGDTIGNVSRFVDRVETEYDLPAEVLTDLRIALDEIVTNIVKYAYPDRGAHEFTIGCAVRGDRLETGIEDEGVPFDPLGAPAPDFSIPTEERKVGGLGLHFVRNLMSGVEYQRVGARNRLTLQQRITKP